METLVTGGARFIGGHLAEQFVEWYRANREWYEPLVLAS
jgi:nucleoside-diphosphate-sugar epimerase